MTTVSTNALQAGLAHDAMVEDILAAIASGELKVGQRIASEMVLRETYGISINSIKAGLAQLVDRGVLRRKRGSGTFVASVDFTAARPLVQRDTIAIMRSWAYWRYHPFFSEQLKGTLAGLARHGWRTLDLADAIRGTSDTTTDDIAHVSIPTHTLGLELAKHPEVAGVISLQGAPALEQGLAEAADVVVSTAANATGPCVYYDWQAELERLFRMALRGGRRSVAVVSSMSAAELDAAWAGACRAAGLGATEATLQVLPCAHSRSSTELISQAYQQTAALLAATVVPDALVVTSDFEAQGVTDALAQLPRQRWTDIAVVALLNKESKLSTAVPLTALLADGYAFGLAVAEMAHEQITSGGRGVARMALSCHEVQWR